MVLNVAQLCNKSKEDEHCRHALETYYCQNTTKARPPIDSPIPGILLTVTDALFALVAIFGNTLVIISVLRFPNLRTTTNMFIFCLAIADFFVGASLPYYVLFYFRTEEMSWTCFKIPCLMRYFTILFGSITSLLFNVGAAVDRYIAIIHPYTYPKMADTVWIYIAIVMAWIYVFVITALPLFGVNIWDKDSECLCKYMQIECDLYFIVKFHYSMMAVAAHVFLTLVLTTGMYIRIFRVAWRQMREMASQEIDPKMRNETRTTRMMVFVLSVCLLSLAPYLVAISIPYAEAQQIEPKPGRYDPNIGLYKKVTVIFYLGKSAVNPIIYGWKNKEFRMAFFKLLRPERAASTAEVRNSGIFVTFRK